jgi:hypothetical protein
MTHMHIMEPYGWVKMENCRVEEREERRWNFDKRAYDGTIVRKYVVGTVADSSYWVGLFCGVQLSKPRNDRYPVGSAYECRIRHESDLVRGETRDIAM